MTRFAVLLACCVADPVLVRQAVAQEVAPWATYRGNVQRTGNTDGKPGPGTPHVLWAMASKEHFIAAPVPRGPELYVSGLGAFNVATFYCLATPPRAAERVQWTKTTPFLKLPTVSAPALAGDHVIFGDGMHQTDGATLYCLHYKTGLGLWQLPVPGKLVHLEGSPTVQGTRVYVGGGSAGVLCVDSGRLLLEGKELDPRAIEKELAQRWKVLVAKYEAAKKKDPDLAVPPTADELPRAAPRRLWQQGKEAWHVDAPVAVVGDRILVASAYLDMERTGLRALLCLNAKTGAQHWMAPLALNPWGGPSVDGDLVFVGSSSIRYDPRRLKGAKGEVAAYNLADGKLRWKKEVRGGVLSCLALSGGLAVATATDGKVRAYGQQRGDSRWVYDGKAPFFAAPAVAGGVVFAGDLRGVLHAIDLKTGQQRWALDLGKTAGIQAPGMVYGGPVVEGGRLYVATCNLEGPDAGRPTVVVCLGEK